MFESDYDEVRQATPPRKNDWILREHSVQFVLCLRLTEQLIHRGYAIKITSLEVEEEEDSQTLSEKSGVKVPMIV